MTKKKKRFYFDPVNPSQLGKQTGTNAFSKKNEDKRGQQESVKLRVYNTILHEHIVDLVNSNYVSEELDQMQVPILSVRMAGDMSVARVYWQASGNAENDEKVQAVLDKYAGKVRSSLISLRVLGNVPRLCFLKDKAAANIAEIDHLLATADLGPTEGDPHIAEWNDPIDEATHLHKGSTTASRGVSNMTESEGNKEQKYKGPNYFAVDHADIHEQIASWRKREDKADSRDGFAPITDSVERFKVFHQKKKAKKNVKGNDAMYRGQLLEEMSDRDFVDKGKERLDYEDDGSDMEMESDTEFEEPDDVNTKTTK